MPRVTPDRPLTSVLLAAGVVGALLGGACADDSSNGALDDPTTTAGEDERAPWPGGSAPTETRELGGGLVAELPEGWEIGRFETGPYSPDDVPAGCTMLWGDVSDGEASVQLQLNSTGCSGVGEDDQIGNGHHGVYVTLDDVREPFDVEEHDVTAGALTTFQQDYFECTNSCTDYRDHVGLLTLADPPDPDHPTLVLMDAKGEVPLDDLVDLADAIHPEAG